MAENGNKRGPTPLALSEDWLELIVGWAASAASISAPPTDLKRLNEHKKLNCEIRWQPCLNLISTLHVTTEGSRLSVTSEPRLPFSIPKFQLKYVCLGLGYVFCLLRYSS